MIFVLLCFAFSSLSIGNAQDQPNVTATLLYPSYWDTTDTLMQTTFKYDDFDWTLTKLVASSSGGNVLISPLGVKRVLCFLKESATGVTGSEIESVLGFKQNRTVVRRKLTKIWDSLQMKSSFSVYLGSGIFVDKVQPRAIFTAIGQEFYRSDLIKMDFDHPATALEYINAWAMKMTENHITDLVHEENVKGPLLVLDANYFRGTWMYQFPLKGRKEATFFVTTKTAKIVTFMTITNFYLYFESPKLEAKILRLPYMDQTLAMYIIVPKSISGLSFVVDKLQDLGTEILSLKMQLIKLSLPKFNFQYTSHLDAVLKNLGLQEVFKDTASLPGIARSQNPLKVSKMIHRSGIEVNEEGDIDHTTTLADGEKKYGPNPTVAEVIANRPFLFYIEHEATKQLVFSGLVTDPTQR